ncbi:MAG: hypothetical protein SFV19_06935 [Rhodospirillaceae bacterium]|nr:hypothetical protein [Rhodospirillaceae bacterium]
MNATDVFFELPLDKWPLFENQTLAHSKLVLGYNMKPQLDMFNTDGIGQGLRDPVNATKDMRLTDKDRSRLAGLLRATSFDVYSVRAAMSEALTDTELAQIKIPEKDQAQLQTYLNNYSRGLLSALLVGTDLTVTSRDSLATIMQSEARGVVLANIVEISKKLGIKPQDIVLYIGKLSEIILAISYYQRVYDSFAPDLRELLLFVKKLHDAEGVGAQFPGLKKDTQDVMAIGRNALVYLKGYFEQFKKVENFFNSITPEKFKALSEGVDKHYRAIGQVVCFWQIRIDQWQRKFPASGDERREGTIQQRYKFFKESIGLNLDKIAESLDVVKYAELNI